jgi:hypothetical protein
MRRRAARKSCRPDKISRAAVMVSSKREGALGHPAGQRRFE